MMSAAVCVRARANDFSRRLRRNRHVCSQAKWTHTPRPDIRALSAKTYIKDPRPAADDVNLTSPARPGTRRMLVNGCRPREERQYSASVYVGRVKLLCEKRLHFCAGTLIHTVLMFLTRRTHREVRGLHMANLECPSHQAASRFKVVDSNTNHHSSFCSARGPGLETETLIVDDKLK